jgi:hypothetical protein
MVNQVFEQRRIEDGGRFELLPGYSRSDHGENAGADDCSDAKRGQRPGTERLLQPVFRLL